MKINLTKNDVLEILARHFGLEIRLEILKNSVTRGNDPTIIGGDIYWEGNEEAKN